MNAIKNKQTNWRKTCPPQNWRRVKLGEIVSVYGGGTPSTTNPNYWNGKIPWLTPAEITNAQQRFIEKTERYITEEGLNNSSARLMPLNSILLTSRATIGEVVINTVPMATNQGFINIEPKKVDLMFLFYWLKKNKKLFNQMAIGSTFNELSKSVFKKIDIFIPEDVADQKRIASILSAFDEKIELNNKISKNLEAMAQAIFKHWFVKSEKLKVKSEKLNKLVKTQYGYTESASDKKIGPKFLRVTDINKTDWVDWSTVPYCKINDSDFLKYKLKKGDVVISRMADPGKVAIVEEDIDAVFASYLIRLQIISEDITPYFLFYYLRSRLYQDFIFGASTGTTRQSANARVITDVELAIPPKQKILEFENLASMVRNKILANVKENQKLAALRDLLLPKLMTGEIKIKTDLKELVFSYLDKLYKVTNDDRLVDKKVRLKIWNKLQKASKITGLSLSELLARIRFKQNDLRIEAMESFLAELRAIFWLRNFGFSKITLIKAKKKTKYPDFEAQFGEKKCAIEVFCLTEKHGQKPDPDLGVYVNFNPQWEGSKFGRDFIASAQRKKEQLDSVNTDIKVLLCVVNSEIMVNANTKEGWEKNAKFLYEKLSWGRGYYIGILTGASVNGKLTDIIYPKL